MTVLTVGLVSCAGKSPPVSGRDFPGDTPVIWLCWAFWPVTGVVSLTAEDSSEAEHSMTEQKRPVLTLKRKTEGRRCPQAENHHQCHHATKVEGEKQKLAGSPEAELAAKAQPDRHCPFI